MGKGGSTGQPALAKQSFGVGAFTLRKNFGLLFELGKSLEIAQTGTSHLRIGDDHFQWYEASYP